MTTFVTYKHWFE